jgi:hypothetical protein
MRKLILTFMASLLSCSAAYAFWPEAAESSLEIGVGYRQDRLRWGTSGFSESGRQSGDECCFGESRVRWKRLNIWEIEARGKYVTCDNIYLRACGDYGWITSGRNRDRDFNRFSGSGNEFFDDDGFFNDDGEFSRSSSRTRGEVYDARLAAGYEFKFCDDSFGLAPLCGYSWHGQRLRDRHLRQSFAFEGDDFGDDVFDYGDGSDYLSTYGYDFAGGRRNHSRYRTHWNGPFVGFDFDYRFWCDWTLFGSYEFHWAYYRARGRWLLRTDLCDGFRHRVRNAYGNLFDIGIRMDFCDCWTVALKGEFQWWYGRRGRDRTLYLRDTVDCLRHTCFVSSRLRRLRWDSAAVVLSVGTIY